MPEDDPATDPVLRGGTPTVRPDAAELQAGQRIGHYKILEQVGEGGFAIVYLAEQEKPVRRRVALKIIKLGMDTRRGRSWRTCVIAPKNASVSAASTRMLPALRWRDSMNCCGASIRPTSPSSSLTSVF